MHYQQHFINGTWVDSTSSESFSVINPSDESIVADVIMGNKEDVNKAVHAAKVALQTWKTSSAEERSMLIRQFADELEHERQRIAKLISESMGMPYHLSLECQVDEPIEILRTYISRTSIMETHEQIGNATVIKKPIGVCALISPWNYPLNQLIGKMAPALAAGCTMVIKPSEQTSLQDFVVMECAKRAGIPDGVINLVTGYGAEVGQALSEHTDIDLISFTGSTRAGTLVAQNAAASVKRVVQELGGKSPLLMTEDCNLEAAVKYGLDDVLINTGQTCTAYTRWLVPKSKLKNIESIILNTIDDYKIGMDEDAYIGPLVNKIQFEKVLGLIQTGMDEGAHLLVGGTEKPVGFEKGYYVKPTVFTNVSNDMTIAKEEIFGPVICLIPYDTLPQAISIANDTPYGLSSAVFSKDTTSGINIAKHIDAGLCYINGGDYNIEAPFGGVKQSGNGREFGDHGLREFYEVQAIHV
jgi:aldehyde dehydrogenase (NAD+)